MMRKVTTFQDGLGRTLHVDTERIVYLGSPSKAPGDEGFIMIDGRDTPIQLGGGQVEGILCDIQDLPDRHPRPLLVPAAV